MRILVIDDEFFVRKLLTHQLTSLGFSDVLAFETAPEALALLERGHRPDDLVFCDLQMPEMDGVEFIRHLVRLAYSGTLALVSGEDERILHTAEKLATAHQLRVLGALHKPVSASALQDILKRSSSGAAPRSPGQRKCYREDELARALREGQLVNHYQPKVDLKTRAVTGVETLVRWQHPEDGLVFPDQFIPMAEESGLIGKLTRAVLTMALADGRRWLDADYRLQIAVNISMDDLENLDILDFIEQATADAGLPTTSLMLEVTESRLMKNPLAPLEILTRLRLKRIGLSIDDFGTGHSSLAQLRDIPFTELKVDRGFVHGASQDPSLQVILEASLGMAHQLGMKTVGEGVEDADDWAFLRQRGCSQAQGWFISKAMPADQVIPWIQRWEQQGEESPGSP